MRRLNMGPCSLSYFTLECRMCGENMLHQDLYKHDRFRFYCIQCDSRKGNTMHWLQDTSMFNIIEELPFFQKHLWGKQSGWILVANMVSTSVEAYRLIV